MNTKTLFSTAILLLLAGTATVPAQAGTVFAYLSAPNQQTVPSTIPGTTTETFDETNMTTGNHTNFSSAIGTYTGTFDVAPNDQYGNGTGNYFAIGSQSGTSTPVTLTFATPVTYFGISYDAGDANNGFTFYDGSGHLIGRFSTANLLAALSGSSVTDLSGNSYATSRYYGQPNSLGTSSTATRTTDGNEPFSFIDFFAVPGTTIGSVVFDNSNTTSTGFESDNHTISTSTNGTPTSGAFVLIGAAGAPDASSLSLLLGALPMVGIVVARRRRR